MRVLNGTVTRVEIVLAQMPVVGLRGCEVVARLMLGRPVECLSMIEYLLKEQSWIRWLLEGTMVREVASQMVTFHLNL